MRGDYRRFIGKYVVPLAMLLMILGFIFLCQPWSEFLHAYSVAITIVGFGVLAIMLIFAIIGMPIVLLYTAGVYYIFQGKVRLENDSY